MHYAVITNAHLFEVDFELCQIPLACTLLFFTSSLSLLISTRLYVVLVLLIYRVVRQMDIALVRSLLTVSIFLSGKSGQTLFE